MNSRDRVKDTTTTTGTGAVTLTGSAPVGFVAFDAVYTAGEARIPYAIASQSGAEWEVGLGTLSGAPARTLTRNRVLTSSNANAFVNFSAGTKDVFVTIPSVMVNDFIPRGRAEMLRLGAFTP
jgi:hypothetical protein